MLNKLFKYRYSLLVLLNNVNPMGLMGVCVLVAEMIRGNNVNQEQFLQVAAPSEPPRPGTVPILAK